MSRQLLLSQSLARGPEPERSSREEVYDVICAAASQNPAQIKASTARLKELLEMTGTFDSLSEIAATRTLPVPVRQQAIIQLKNSSLNHWKSRKLLDPDQRANIRARSLSLLDEQDDVIAECNEVIIGKVARQEYPSAWPTLLDDIFTLIHSQMAGRYGAGADSSSAIALRRALEVLNQILKEFASVKMLTGINTTANIISKYYQPLEQNYSTASARLASLDPTSIATQRVAEDILFAHLTFKPLVKAAVWLWPRLLKNSHDFGRLQPWFQMLFQNCAVQVQALTELRTQLVVALRAAPPADVRTAELSIRTLTRHIALFGKFFRRLQQLEPARFVHLPVSGDLILWYWNKVVEATGGPAEYIEDSQAAVFPVRFLVQAMVLFKESLAQWAPERKDGKHNEHVLNKTFVEDAVRLLVTRFIPLKAADLEGWQEDPEDWVNHEEQDNEMWEYEIRPCAERVLMVLTNQYHQFVVPYLFEVFKDIVSKAATDLTSILQREAVYCAMGRTCTRMKTVIPFDQWLASTLVPEARQTNPQYSLIKRRIAWLVGKWIGSDSASPNNSAVWELLVWLLQDRGPGSDAVVRLTAAVSLKECLDTTEFEADVFAPYLPIAVTELVRLRSEADTMEIRSRICTSLNVVIERVDMRIVPHMNIIVEPIPKLWTDAADNWLFKGVLLESVTKLVDASKEESAALSQLIVALVKESFAPVAAAQLDEDGLILWRAALHHTKTLDGIGGQPGLFELTPLALELLEKNLDLLGKIVSIVKSYALLDAPRLLHDQNYATSLFVALKNGMSHAIPINARDMAVTLGMVIQLAPSSSWGEPMHNSGLFAYLVKTLEEDKVQTSILTEYVLVLARIAIADRQMFLQLMQAAAQVARLPEAQLWEAVLNQWWTRFDNMSEPRHRKICAMGAASLVATGRHEVLDRLYSEICNMWLDVFGELREALSNEGDDPTLVLYWDQPTDAYFDGSQDTAEHDRLKSLWSNDVARTTMLTVYVGQCLQQAEAMCGGGEVLQAKYLSKADAVVLDELKREITGQGPGNRRY